MKLKVAVHPGSKNPRVEKDSQGVFHIYVSEPPTDGKANSACVEVLAEYFDTAKSNIQILRGHTSKQKLFEIEGL